MGDALAQFHLTHGLAQPGVDAQLLQFRQVQIGAYGTEHHDVQAVTAEPLLADGADEIGAGHLRHVDVDHRQTEFDAPRRSTSRAALALSTRQGSRPMPPNCRRRMARLVSLSSTTSTGVPAMRAS